MEPSALQLVALALRIVNGGITNKSPTAIMSMYKDMIQFASEPVLASRLNKADAHALKDWVNKWDYDSF